MTPVELVVSRVHGAKAKGSTRHMALCPAHDDRGPSLSIGEGRDGRALVRCFAGCTADAIVASLGLVLADLMPPSDPDRRRAESEARNAMRRRMRANRPETVRAVLASEVDRARVERLRRDPGDTPHVRGHDVRQAYARVEALLGITMPRVPRAAGSLPLYAVRDRRWEGWAPHDRDPQWPALFAHALTRVAWEWDAIVHPERRGAPPARMPARYAQTPGGRTYDDLAGQRAARELRILSRRRETSHAT